MKPIYYGMIAVLSAILASQTTLLGAPVGTAFTYQGRLTVAGVPADGVFDVSFRLMTAAGVGIGDSQVGATVVFSDVVLTDGLFTGQLDFGDDAMTGEARWLEVSIRPGAGLIYTVLAPRQKLTPAPYAIGLSLPYVGSASSNTALFNLHQDGSGGAASISIDDPNGGSALYLQSSSAAPAQYTFAAGTGSAGEFVVYNAASTAKALVGETIGFGTGVYGKSSKGKAGWFQINTATNGSDAVLAETNGDGDAVRANNSSATGGRAGWFRVTNAGNPSEAFRAETYGTGKAGYFRIFNSNSPAAALATETNGSGSALYAANTGSGPALQLGPGSFKVDGAGVNTDTVVFIHTTTAANIDGNNTAIDHPLTNGKPNAILIVTPNKSAPGLTGLSNPHAVGVGYYNNKWEVYNVDVEPFEPGIAFNVMVINP